MRFVILAVAALLVVLGSSTTWAQQRGATIVSEISAEELASLFSERGESVTVSLDTFGDPLVEGGWLNNGFSVFFYCSGAPSCAHIEFSATFLDTSSPIERMNDWNENNLFGKAVLTDASHPRLDYAVNLSHGVTIENLNAQIDLFYRLLDKFTDHILQDEAAIADDPVSAAPADPGYFSVCNEFNDTVYVATAESAGDTDDNGETRYISAGWVRILAGECHTLWETPFEHRYYYIHAKTISGRVWSGDYIFCTKALDEFFIVGTTDCDPADQQGFEVIEVEDPNRGVVYHLTDRSGQ